MDIQMRLDDCSKNRASFTVVNTEDKGGALKQTGNPNYGQMNIIVVNKEDLDALKVGEIYNVSIETNNP